MRQLGWCCCSWAWAWIKLLGRFGGEMIGRLSRAPGVDKDEEIQPQTVGITKSNEFPHELLVVSCAVKETTAILIVLHLPCKTTTIRGNEHETLVSRFHLVSSPLSTMLVLTSGQTPPLKYTNQSKSPNAQI